ncbi:hypothetical protein DOM22_08345 [Bdellovibrio sp. ZAP7]|uniref:hypothetical protein n=1 Tax=Bdellovibrio sp. ZAP7 TaxID=2231053 RepID=UPI00115C19F2|nr:hypothetical protein [Bdellovibrio sp. ZAP7]QDK45165.1 hypothetical protein DOM22_08345 [Bdellovibrio sp. ZAP7]
MKKSLTLLCLSLILSVSALAAEVTAVKNGRVMVKLQGAEVHPGDEFFLIDSVTHKKIGIIRIKQTKEDRAVADVIKGRGATGNTLQAKGAGSASVAKSKTAPKADTSRQQEALNRASTPDEEASVFDKARDMSFLRTLKNSYGVLGQYGMDTMKPTIKENPAINPPEQPELKGTGLGAGGFYEWVLTRNITLRGLGMLEQYNVSGQTNKNVGCKGSTHCSANITYLSGYALAKYYFTTNQLRTWAGLGGGFLIAMSKSATALDENQIATNQVLTISAGGEYQLNRKTFIPFSVEYVYFPPSDTVTANAILFRVGYGWQ